MKVFFLWFDIELNKLNLKDEFFKYIGFVLKMWCGLDFNLWRIWSFWLVWLVVGIILMVICLRFFLWVNKYKFVVLVINVDMMWLLFFKFIVFIFVVLLLMIGILFILNFNV